MVLHENLVCTRVSDGRRSLPFTAESCRALKEECPLALSASNLDLHGSGRQGVHVFSDASVQLPVDRDRTWIAAGLALQHNCTSCKSPTPAMCWSSLGFYLSPRWAHAAHLHATQG